MKLILASSSKPSSQINEKALIVAADSVIYMNGKIYEEPKNKEEAYQNMKEMSDEDIKWYVENEENILNRCGYAMLGKASIFLDKVNGDYNTLFGIFPSKIYEKFKELGYKISDFELE